MAGRRKLSEANYQLLVEAKDLYVRGCGGVEMMNLSPNALVGCVDDIRDSFYLMLGEEEWQEVDTKSGEALRDEIVKLLGV